MRNAAKIGGMILIGIPMVLYGLVLTIGACAFLWIGWQQSPLITVILAPLAYVLFRG